MDDLATINSVPPKAAPAHPVAHVHEAIAMAQARHHLFVRPSAQAAPTVLVLAVSGGPDSVCLLYALRHLAPTWGLSLHVAHLDHGLRPDSTDDADFVAQLARQWALPCHIRRLPSGLLQAEPGGLEEVARRARYTFLWEVAQEITPGGQTPTIVLAHHADDQAETVLMNFVRGSGLDGLAGMRWVSTLAVPDRRLAGRGSCQDTDQEERPVRLVRPLLNVRRAQILRYLNAQGLSWREDASNQDITLRRNYLRQVIVPQLAELNPNWVATVGRTAQILAGQSERLRRQDEANLDALLIDPPVRPQQPGPARLVLALASWQHLDLASQRGVVRLALEILAPQADIGFDRIDDLVWALHESSCGGVTRPLAGGIAWTAARGQVSLHRADVLPFHPDHPYLERAGAQWQTPVPVPVPGRLAGVNGWCLVAVQQDVAQLAPDWRRHVRAWQALLDADRVNGLVLTTPRPGLQFVPLGMGGHHKSVGDLFTDRKVPVALRDGWPLILDATSGQVLWICGLQLAHLARLTETSRKAISLRWEKET